jgi:hypothetical protein
MRTIESVKLTKRLVIEYDIVDGEMRFENEDDMSYGEILAALEYTKMMIMKDWLGVD